MKQLGITSEDPQVQKDATEVLADVIGAVNAFAVGSDCIPQNILFSGATSEYPRICQWQNVNYVTPSVLSDAG